MKNLFAILIIVLIASCAIPAPQVEPESGEAIIDGLWGGWQIIAGGMVFNTPIGIKTIGYHVQVVQHNGQWYIWENGYGMEIALENQQ